MALHPQRRPLVFQVGNEKHGAANGGARQDDGDVIAVAALPDADPGTSGERGIIAHFGEETWPCLKRHMVKVGMLSAC